MNQKEEAEWLANIKGNNNLIKLVDNLSEETLLSLVEYLRKEPQRSL